ncbi:MAG: serine hydrolase family protein [Acidimicrobiaceae bacterium]|nr:serine hydrolase family protein [Acidimicrobiaceae bacterium]
MRRRQPSCAAGADRPRPCSRIAVGGAIAVIALVAAACGSSSPAASTSSLASTTTTTTSTTTTSATTTSTTTTSTSTTTTTLPKTTSVPGSGVSTAASAHSFGAVERVHVVPVPDGQAAPPPAPFGSAAAANALVVAYHQVGSGPDLLLVMGQRGSMSWWDPQFIQSLSQHYRVTFFDLPGVGYSEDDPAANSVESLADVTAGLSAALGLTQPVVLGWGLGGEVALALAERHPALASKLVLVEASAGGNASVPPIPAVAKSLADPALTLTQVSSLLFPSTATAARASWMAQVAAQPPDDVTAAAVRRVAAIQASYYAHDASVSSDIALVRIPALVVTGTADQIVPPANSVALVEGLTKVRQLVLKGAGYAGIFQQSTKTINALEAFTG